MNEYKLKSWACSCLRKKRYPNEQVAKIIIDKIIKKDKRKVNLRCYFCKLCNGWHLTHKI